MSGFDPEALLKTLVGHGVDFVVIGGIAVAMHGMVRTTQDVDIYYERSRQNIARLCAALSGLEPKLRGRGNAPIEDVQLRVDEAFLLNGENFTFVTRLGGFDCLGFVDGALPYAVVKANAMHMDIDGTDVLVASAGDLIKMKEVAGRDVDRLDVVALRKVIDLSS